MHAVRYICLLSLFAVPLTAQSLPDNPCARLAPQLGLKLRTGQEGPVEWRVNLLGGLGKALFGGSASVAFRIETPDETDAMRTPDEKPACTMVKGDMTCNAVGPATVLISTKRGDATLAVAAGERARVGTRGTHFFCRDGR